MTIKFVHMINFVNYCMTDWIFHLDFIKKLKNEVLSFDFTLQGSNYDWPKLFAKL